MRYRQQIIFSFFILCLTLFSSAVSADDVQVTASVDKQTAYQDEEVNLSVKISGVKGNIPAPRLPHFTGIDSFYSGRASHFSFINGRSESRVEFNYVLVPKTSGHVTLDPIAVTVDGKTYKTEPISIEVMTQSSPVQQRSQIMPSQVPVAPPQTMQTNSAPPPPSSAVPSTQEPMLTSEGGDPNIFLRAAPSKQVVYPNEQLLLTYTLLTRYDTSYEGFEQEPETRGFWIEEFPMERDLGKRTEMVNHRKYISADIKKLALFPTAPGSYDIKPGTVKVSVQLEQKPSSMLDEFFSDSFFSGSGLFSRRIDKVLTVPPMTITVKPFPEAGKPKNFNGAVGDFRMSGSIDKMVVNQNEPVTMKLNIEGEGNIETLSHPALPELPDVKTYDSDTKTEFFKAENIIAGKKTYEIIFIPKLAGMLTIPPLEFSFFNPKTERYVTLTTEPFSVKVNVSLNPLPELPKEMAGSGEESKQEIKLEGRDIRFIHERFSTAKSLVGRWLLIFFIANAFLTSVFIVLLFLNRREQFFNVHVALKRERYAKRNAEKALRKLKHIARKEEKSVVFFDQAERLMNQYLADKLNLSPQGLTQAIIAEKLTEKGISQELIQQMKRFYDDCGLVRFSPAGSFQKNSQDILQEIQLILKAEI